MPKLPTYTNNVFPNSGSTAEKASSERQSAYYLGQTIEQGFRDLGRGVSKFQDDRERQRREAEQEAEQEDLANLSVAFAMQDADVAVRWSKAMSEADPNDSGLQKRFMDTTTAEYGKIMEGAKTKKGRLYAMKARAESFKSNYISTAADQANMNAAAGVAQLDTINNAYSAAAFYDPANWQAQVEKIKLAVDSQAEAHNMNPKDALKLETEMIGNAARSGLKGWIDKNPEQALKSIEEGEYNGYLTGEEIASHKKSAETRISELENDKVSKVTAEERAMKKQANIALADIQMEMKVDPSTNKMDIPDDYFSKLDSWYNEYKGIVSEDDYTAAKKLGLGELQRADRDALKTSDKATIDKLYGKLQAGTLTERDADLARGAGLITVQDHAFYRGAVPNDTKGEDQVLKNFMASAKGNEGYITKSVGQYKDDIGKALMADYMSDMGRAYSEMTAKGYTPEQMEEYARKALPKYALGFNEINKLKLEARKNKTLFMAPNIDPPKVMAPGQSLGDFYRESNVRSPVSGITSLASISEGETHGDYSPSMEDEKAVATTPASLQRSPYQNASTFLDMNEGMNEKTIEAFLKAGGYNININGPSSTPWCAAFVNAALAQSGLIGTGKLTARSFLVYGESVSPHKAQKGDIVVLERGSDPTKGHVGFFDHYDKDGNIVMLSGNAGSKGSVNLQTYSRGKLLGVRRPGASKQQIASL